MLLRVPLVLVNVDAVPGLVHRLLGRFAAASAVAFPGTPLPRAVVTGAPVREEVLGVDRSPVGRRPGPRRPRPAGRPATVAVFGGSLGARRINQAVDGLADEWAGRGDVAVYHVTGRRNWRAAPGDGPTGPRPYRRVPFEERMALLYEAADVVVCRAGAITVAELAVAGVPACWCRCPALPVTTRRATPGRWWRPVPRCSSPTTSATGARLAAVLDDLLGRPDRLAAMGDAARQAGRPDAAARVAELVDGRAR